LRDGAVTLDKKKQVVEKVILPRLFKNTQMQTSRSPEGCGVLGRTPQRQRMRETLEVGVFQQLKNSKRGGSLMRALFVLTPSESKRLIGRAVASMEEVKKAKANDKILIGHGSTNVFVAEEVMGRDKLTELMNRNAYLSGITKCGILCTIPGEEKPPMLVLNRGMVEPPAATMADLLRDFGSGSVFIKGANAVDPERNAAAFVAHPEGGTIGWAIGTILARGICLIVPVGLEKLVPSVRQAVSMCGQMRFDYCLGIRVGMVPLSGAKVVTEVEALKMLTGVESFHVASGGCGDSQGAVTLVSEGDAEGIEKAIQTIEAIKGESPLDVKRGICATCILSSPAQLKNDRRIPAGCQFQGKVQEDLPPFLRNR
jgi:hypothetical protein